MGHGVAGRRQLCGIQRRTRAVGCAGAAPMPAPHLRAVASGAYPLTPLSSLITTARACLHSVSFFPYGKDGFAPPAPAWERLSVPPWAASPVGVGPLPSAELLGLHQSFCVLCFLFARHRKRRVCPTFYTSG